jgi:hypothetical protein
MMLDSGEHPSASESGSRDLEARRWAVCMSWNVVACGRHYCRRSSLPHTDHINSERFSNKEKALCNIG